MRGGRPTGDDARGRKSASGRPGIFRRLALLGITTALLVLGAPVGAMAEPRPGLKKLAAEVERLHNEIEILTEQYNGERVRLATAQRAAKIAKQNLAKAQAELAERRKKASALAQNSYMTGGLGTALALIDGTDPKSYLNQAATTYALEMQQSQEVAAVATAMKAAQRAKEAANARQAEVEKLLKSLEARRVKIQKLVKKAESDLYRRVAISIDGPAKKMWFPIIGKGKAAEAARWALTQQLKPYIWGGAGPHGYDCSGLVMAAYQRVGISLPHYTGDLWRAGTHISRDQLRPGDLVFFYNDLHHVGIYIGGGYMIHAPRTGDVVRIAKISGRPYAGAVRIAD